MTIKPLFTFFIALIVLASACSESSESSESSDKKKQADPIEVGIQGYISDNKLEKAKYEIIDTVAHSQISDARMSALKSNAITDSMIVVMPERIIEREASIEEAKKNQEENTSQILAATWDELVAQNEEQLKTAQQTLEDFETMKAGNDAYLEFLSKFEEQGDYAFLMTNITHANGLLKVAVRHDGKVFEFPENFFE